jgi:putative ABC transport system ATP-binding protein
MEKGAILSTRNVTKRFGSGPTSVCAVDDVSLDIAEGEIVLVMGPSGSGKTTLLSMMGGLLRPSSGSVVIAGNDISELPESKLPGIRARHIGFIFQAFNLLGALTVEENVLLPAQLAAGGLKEARGRVGSLLDRLDLAERRNAYPRTLSGGEMQRVAIARALINRAPLLLADEPTGNLDSQKGQEVTMILHDIARDEGCSVVIVTHDPRIEDVADTVLWLEDGRLGDRPSRSKSWARDPVCGMQLDESTSDFSTNYQGQRYVFCSESCLDRFKAGPELYVDVEVDAGEAIEDA